MSKDVNWPQGEPIPQSVEEALALGWEIDSEEAKCSDDERTHTGIARLTKELGLYVLKMTVPFRAEYSFGAPSEPHAVLNDDFEIATVREGKEDDGRELQVQ